MERQHDGNSIHQGEADMTFWVILAITTSAAAALLSAPFIRRLDRPRAELAGNIEVCRDQLKEVESKQRQGLIDDAQAEASRLEIAKRVLAADRSEQPVMPKLSVSERNFTMICVAGIVVLGSVGLYTTMGNPDLPSTPVSVAAQPVSTSLTREPSIPENLMAPLQAFASETKGQSRSQAGLPPVDEMIQRLTARLLQNPKDAQGWRTLGWSYFNIGRFNEASEAYAKAIELNPNVADVRSARIEAMVRSADGIVTAEASNAIDDTLKIDPQNARARYFRGLAKEQGGDKTSALTDWIEVRKDANPDEPWVPELKNRISGLQRELGLDAGAGPTEPKTVMAGESPETSKTQGSSQLPSATAKGPGPQDVRTAEAMPAAERSAMIRGMVDRLADRLEKSPRDADGWIKLIQSRMVLGETELAKQALNRGIETFNDDTPQRDRIIAAAQQIGLNQQ
jgi:cytochrome c-type biogenesis protein CcmH